MIRLIQRRLIIPRGDTGSFSIPALKNSTDNIAVFTIFDELTHTKMFQKTVPTEGDVITIAFTHSDTVNLKPGKYVWDVKYYSNPEYIDDELVNGEEIDSYYAGFSLPVCEIKETADNYLVSPDAPAATLSPQQLEVVTGAIHSLNEAIRKTQENVEHYPEIRDDIWYVWDSELNDYVSTHVRAKGTAGNGIASAVLNDDYTLTLNFTDDASFTSPSIRGQRGNGIEDIVLNNDFSLTITYTDGDSYVTPSIRGPVGATPQMGIGTVQTLSAGSSAIASMSGTAENPLLNLSIPKGDKGDTGEKGDKGEKGDTYEVTPENIEEISSRVIQSATIAQYTEGMADQVEAAQQHAKDAGESATAADTAKKDAAQSAQASSQSATAADTSARNAAQSATNAGNSASAASQSAQAASQSATNAAQSERNAADSAQDAQDVLDSIPADYSALSSDVTDLKSALNTNTDVLDFDINGDGRPYAHLGVLNSNGTWSYAEAYQHCIIIVTPGDTIRVKRNGANPCIYAWLKSYNFANGDTADLVDGTSRTTISDMSVQTLTVPDGTRYLYLNKTASSGSVDYFPSELSINGLDRINTIRGIISGMSNALAETNSTVEECEKIIDKIADQVFGETVLSQSAMAQSYDSTYQNVGYITSSGGFESGANYRTYYYHNSGKMEVYVECTGSPTYISLAIWNGTPSTANFIGRYRSNDGNLPTDSNRLEIAPNNYIAVTFLSSTPNAVGVQFHTGIYGAYKLNTVKKTATSFEITNGNAKYYVNRYDNDSINAHLWRTNRCDVKTGAGFLTIWNNSDSDGVVQLSGESDFIGGYHGDEVQSLAKFFIDGVEVNSDAVFDETEYKTITMFFTSTVYHCESETAAFIRHKVLMFDNNGYTTKNYWIASEDLQYITAYLGMLSVDRYLADGTTPLINGYYTDATYEYVSKDDGTNRNETINRITEVSFDTAYGRISIKMKNPRSNENHIGYVYNYNTAQQQRLKAYLGFGSWTPSGSSGSWNPITLHTGDTIQAESTIVI